MADHRLLFAGLLLLTACSRQPDSARSDKIQELAKGFDRSVAVPVLSLAGLVKLNDSEYLLVDVRTPLERSVSMIPGSVSREDYESVKDSISGRMVVAYCTIGSQSGPYAEALSTGGVDAYSLHGGILNWIDHQLPLIDTTGVTQNVRVPSSEFNLAPEGYNITWE